MVLVRPGNRIFGRRWEQILVLDVGRVVGLSLVQGHLDTLGLAATYSVPRHKATLSIHQLKPHLDRFTHANILRGLKVCTQAGPGYKYNAWCV